MNYPTITARQLLKTSLKTFNEDLPEVFNILFDNDETILTGRKKAHVTRVIWIPFKYFDKVPLTKELYITNYITPFKTIDPNGNNIVIKKIKLSGVYKLFTAINTTIIRHYGFDKENMDLESLDILKELLYSSNQILANEMSFNTIDNIDSVDILDMLALAEDEKVLNIKFNDKLTLKEKDEEFFKLTREDYKFLTNRYNTYFIRELLDSRQYCQTVFMRGMVSESNGLLIDKVITDNYTTGFSDPEDIINDSAVINKSMVVLSHSLSTAEYASRRFQLISSYIDKLVIEDCGGTLYEHLIESDKHFFNMIGVMYHDEESNSLKELYESDTHLIGKTIKIRSPIGCKTSNPKNVCTTCFGGLSRNVPIGTNLGYLCGASSGKVIANLTLQTKHVTSVVSNPNGIVDREKIAPFFIANDNNEIFFSNEYRGKEIKIFILKDEIPTILDLDILEPDKIDPLYNSQVTKIKINVFTKSEEESFIINIGAQLKNTKSWAICSTNFILYMLHQGVSVCENGKYFIINMDEWDNSVPMFVSVEKEFAAHNLAGTISSIIETGPGKNDDPNNLQYSKLLNLFNTIINCLSINISSVGVLVKAISAKKGTKLLTNGQVNSEIEILDKYQCISRSLGTSMGFERHLDTLMSNSIVDPDLMTDSVFDVLLKPKEVIEKYGNKTPVVDLISFGKYRNKF